MVDNVTETERGHNVSHHKDQEIISLCGKKLHSVKLNDDVFHSKFIKKEVTFKFSRVHYFA